MMAALDPKSATQWRAWVALTICGNQGVRQNAALHLQWDDVDELLGVMIWRSQWDKMGREWSQPIRSATREALRVAREWREKNEYAGPWVLPQGSSKSKSEVYTLGSLWQALKGAETRSGVARINRRGGHSLRRKVAGDVNAATGDPALALLSIGDTDLRQANTYLKKRDERVKGAFDQLDHAAKTDKERSDSGSRQPAIATDGL
jgi:integrase